LTIVELTGILIHRRTSNSSACKAKERLVARGQVALTVADLDESIAFYTHRSH